VLISEKKNLMNLRLQEKINETAGFLKRELAAYRAPVVNCSFGKDSLCMLHLMLMHEIKLPIVTYMHPYFPRKNRLALGLSDSFDQVLYNYPPYRISMMYGRTGEPAIVEEFMTSPVTTTAIPIDIIEYRDGDDPGKYRCGVDLLTRPTGTFSYPWDACVIGHKDVDSDTIYGDVPLATKILYRDAGPDCLFPLKDWSHDDVWDYLETYDIKVQADRYDQPNRREWDDKMANPDWWEACIRCVDKRHAGTRVFCPKLKTEIDNVSESVPEFTHVFDYFGEEAIWPPAQ
jgi:hypothetical protein